jgi:hypothetical protein
MTVHFRKDVYNRDSTLEKALDEVPPRPEPHYVISSITTF